MKTPTISAMMLAGAMLLTGCEKVVSIDLNEGPKQLVIEARLERVRGAVSGAQTVRLTTTDSYFSNAAPPPARGATVRIVDDAGTITALTEDAAAPGVYRTTSLIGQIGTRYTLKVDYQGEHYEATETLLPIAPIDTLYFMDRKGQLGPKEGKRATIDFQEPGNVQNFYVWDQYVDGVRLLSPDSTIKFRVVGPDDGLDGRRIREFQPYDGVAIKSGSQVLIRQMALSEPMYLYYLALSNQAANDGSPFSVPLASVRSNIANTTNVRHRPLGYFMATEVAEARARAP